MDETAEIQSQDYWYKVVAMLQQNWALIDSTDCGTKVYFIGDTSVVFDQIQFDSVKEAEKALLRNGFKRLDDDKEAQKFIAKSKPPFHRMPHPNGPIYSSGRFWK